MAFTTLQSCTGSFHAVADRLKGMHLYHMIAVAFMSGLLQCALYCRIKITGAEKLESGMCDQLVGTVIHR